MNELDKVEIHFDNSSLWVLNIALAIVMFGVSLGISVEDFNQYLLYFEKKIKESSNSGLRIKIKPKIKILTILISTLLLLI